MDVSCLAWPCPGPGTTWEGCVCLCECSTHGGQLNGTRNSYATTLPHLILGQLSGRHLNAQHTTPGRAYILPSLLKLHQPPLEPVTGPTVGPAQRPHRGPYAETCLVLHPREFGASPRFATQWPYACFRTRHSTPPPKCVTLVAYTRRCTVHSRISPPSNAHEPAGHSGKPAGRPLRFFPIGKLSSFGDTSGFARSLI